jgi:hypothetical protein
VIISTMLVLTCLALTPIVNASQSNQPLHEGPFQFHVTFQDFFSDPRGPQCQFPVVGDWNVVVTDEIYFDQQSGIPIRVQSFFNFIGSLSNAETGKSVPDGGAFKLIDYLAADGSIIREVEIENRRLSPYLHATFRAVTDAQGDIVFDSGRDWLFTARHPLDITPLCSALSN